MNSVFKNLRVNFVLFLDHYHFHLQGIEWKRAVRADNNFISKYAKDYPGREDIAESAVAWMAARCRRERQIPNKLLPGVKEIEEAIPNRLDYFDKYLSCW